jgi:hypothetical protein
LVVCRATAFPAPDGFPDAFITAAYRDDTAAGWTAQQATKWLAFLARHLERTIVGPDLAWWQLPLAVPNLALWIGLVAAVAAGTLAVFGIEIGIETGVVAGGVVGIMIGVGVGILAASGAAVGVKGSPTPAHGIRWKSPSLSVVGVGAAAGIVAGTLFRASGLGDGYAAAAGAGFGTVVGAGIWLITQEGAPLDISSAASPPALLAWDRRAAIKIGLGPGRGSWPCLSCSES